MPWEVVDLWLRTLGDYTNNNPGFHDEVIINNCLLKFQRVFLNLEDMIDEMKIKEGLTFNKHMGEIIGFTNLGNVEDELLWLEKESEQPTVAKQIPVLMIRGLLFKLEFPYAHFGTHGIIADVLFPIAWETIQRLETHKLKVLW